MTKKTSALSLLALGALGVVFGDIGTSTLYALQAVVHLGHIPLDKMHIYGIVSLIIWSISVVVTVKYLGIIMKASNQGEGGIMALVALVQSSTLHKHAKVWLTLLGILGVALFYGDSVITPAISVLSAVEGVTTVFPSLSYLVIPLTIVVLIGLFALQSRGTTMIGRLFGPVMLLWFVVSALGGIAQITAQPDVLTALLPTTAIAFVTSDPIVAFVAMGAVVLAITGAEALYADMGHFGRRPIGVAWLWCVFPALALNYMGQGALIVTHPEAITSSYYLLFPEEVRLFVVILATFATLIASQAVIAGTFSLTRQAIQLGFAPWLRIRFTSNNVGQVYLPFINWLLCCTVIALVVAFGSSAHLAGAFGMAVSMTLLIDTMLLLVIMDVIWRTPRLLITLSACIFLTIDFLFFSSSLTKLFHGGWLPITIAVVVFTVFSTWTKGRHIISGERQHIEGRLTTFIAGLPKKKIVRLPGTAVYIGHHPSYTPLALHAAVDQLHELHEKVAIVNVVVATVPHIHDDDRIVYDDLGSPDDGISHLTLQFGFKDSLQIPHALSHLHGISEEVDFDPETVTYFISAAQPVITRRHVMARWRKLLYVMLRKNATQPTDYYHLPAERTIEITSYVDL